MNTFESLIVIASVAGCVIGALGVHLYYRPRMARKEKETWSAARIYYKRRYSGTN